MTPTSAKENRSKRGTMLEHAHRVKCETRLEKSHFCIVSKHIFLLLSETTMLFVDKYRPKALSELHYHQDLSTRLSSLGEHEDFPHTLIYGPSGAGKKTRIACLLRELYGSGTYKVR